MKAIKKLFVSLLLVNTLTSIVFAEDKNVSSNTNNQSIYESLGMIKIPGKDFYMLKTEVPQELYTSIMGENPSYFKEDNNPVESVSWYDAIYFCNKLSLKYGLTPVYAVKGKTDVAEWKYTPHKSKEIKNRNITQNANANGFRLPTVDEWEYAAKGGQSFTYAGSNNIDEVGWYKDNSGNITHSVAQKEPNGYGLYDMSGNVDEWCWNAEEYFFSYKRFYHGGSWNSSCVSCTFDYSTVCYATYRYNYLGFRIVCN